jgi:hypothetical protein
MPTLNVTMSGSTLLPAAVTKGYATFADADFQRILNWVNSTQAPLLEQMFGPAPSGYSNSQIYQAWVQVWINESISREQITLTGLPKPPVQVPPVVIGP